MIWLMIKLIPPPNQQNKRNHKSLYHTFRYKGFSNWFLYIIIIQLSMIRMGEGGEKSGLMTSVLYIIKGNIYISHPKTGKRGQPENQKAPLISDHRSVVPACRNIYIYPISSQITIWFWHKVQISTGKSLKAFELARFRCRGLRGGNRLICDCYLIRGMPTGVFARYWMYSSWNIFMRYFSSTVWGRSISEILAGWNRKSRAVYMMNKTYLESCY